MKHRILFIGAHPDDCEVNAGGLIIKHLAAGNSVKLISTTNGCAGHYSLDRKSLATRRKEECEAVAKLTGAEYEVWDIPDGELTADIKTRKKMVAAIRDYRPDLVITHRLCDYHPDHRATGQLVQDASYLLIVPNFCPQVKPLDSVPVIAFFYDNFNNPPFRPDAVTDVGNVMEDKFKLLACHRSQMFEWLPYTTGMLDSVPAGEAEKMNWLKLPLYDLEVITDELKNKMTYSNGECKFGIQAEKFRDELKARLGENGGKMRYAETFEISEYGSRVDDDKYFSLFFSRPPVSKK